MASGFRICYQICDQKYGSSILCISGLALRPFRQKWGNWPSEWISGNSHQSRHSACLFRHVHRVHRHMHSFTERKENIRTGKSSLLFATLLAGSPCTLWGPAIVMVHFVRLFVHLSVCRPRISNAETKRMFTGKLE